MAHGVYSMPSIDILTALSPYDKSSHVVQCSNKQTLSHVVFSWRVLLTGKLMYRLSMSITERWTKKSVKSFLATVAVQL